jgi:nucleotide-binding universal stress UspA family protein
MLIRGVRRSIATERNANMNKQNAQRFVVVVAVDASEAATLVVRAATQLASSISGSEIHLVHTLENFKPVAQDEIPNPWSGTAILERGREHLQNLGRVASEKFQGRVVGHLASGEPWREVVQMAENFSADLIVVGTQNLKGLKRIALGSVSEHVVRNAKCPVLVVRKTDYQTRDVPEIEPACPDCLVTQRETAGATLWCDRHATHHPHARLHYEVPQSFAIGSGLLRP